MEVIPSLHPAALDTCLQGYIRCSPKQMMSKLLTVYEDRQDVGGKISTICCFLDVNGSPWTIYDYKITSTYDPGLPSPSDFRSLGTEYSWHVGGFTGADEKRFLAFVAKHELQFIKVETPTFTLSQVVKMLKAGASKA
jgi:hypothetical protein